VIEHYEAIEYDLITRTAYTLDDVGGRLSWSALSSFIKNLDTGSALAKDLDKTTGWENTLQANIILADIYDLLQVTNSLLVAMATQGKKRKKIKPYPRPGKDRNTRKLGKGAMPLNALSKWMEEMRNGKRRKH
jgi:hypothetical protein